jgi:aspartyl/glutamyl-tRNA(Asn/Gln) amidotransferase C subunit
VPVSREDVRRAGELARLSLDPAELAELTAQLNAILEHMEALGAAPVEAPPAPAAADGAPLRADEPAPDPLHAPLRRVAPSWQAGFFTVPRLASHDEPGGGGDDGGKGRP